jgi:hypothetical protein
MSIQIVPGFVPESFVMDRHESNHFVIPANHEDTTPIKEGIENLETLVMLAMAEGSLQPPEVVELTPDLKQAVAQQGAIANLATTPKNRMPNIMNLQSGVCTTASSRKRKGTGAVNASRSRLMAEERLLRLIRSEQELAFYGILDFDEDEWDEACQDLLAHGDNDVPLGPCAPGVAPMTWFLLRDTLTMIKNTPIR